MKLNLFLSSIAVLVAASTIALGQDYTCTKDKPCASGCCRLDANGQGNCGLGPTFCGAGNCISGCDSKAECNPGWDPKFSAATACPLNVCCGQYGYCGTTANFCGNKTVQRPSCSASTTNGRTIGYFEGWSPGAICNQVTADKLPLGYYTHINLAFISIDPKTFEVLAMDNVTSSQYNRMTALKVRQPSLKTWISVGGYAFNDPNTTTATTFSDLAASTEYQQKFFKSLLAFMAKYKFDGVDIDWEYPVAPERSGTLADYQNLVTWLQNMRRAFDTSGNPNRLGISVTLPASYFYLKNFDLVNIEPSVDWFNMMTYDLHGTWDTPKLALAHNNLTEIEQSLDLMWRNNIDPLKVNMGLGFYGRSFTLANSTTCTGTGCPFVSGGMPGKCTNTSGILGATEIKSLLLDPKKNVTVTYDPKAAVQIATWDETQWMAYDDVNSFAAKIKYANSKCMGGTMVWALDLDTDGAMSEALAFAAQLPKQFVINGTTGFLNSTALANGTATAQYSNSTMSKTSAPVSTGNSTITAATSTADDEEGNNDMISTTTSVSLPATASTMSPFTPTPTATAAFSTNSTAAANTTAGAASGSSSGTKGAVPSPVGDGSSSSCSAWYLVQKGDGCANIATAAKVDLKDFYSWNPAVKSDCSGLMTDFYVCVGVSPTPATTIATALALPAATSA